MPYLDLHRRSIRIQGFDYRQEGAYYVTIAAFRHEDLFGERVEERVSLNEIGRVVAWCWQELANQFSLSLDEWILMPDHLHGILFLEKPVISEGQETGRIAGTQPESLGAVVQNFKAVTTRKINRIRGVSGLPVWQRNYYEHVIRDDGDLNRIRQYIVENPLRHFLKDTAEYDR